MNGRRAIVARSAQSRQKFLKRVGANLISLGPLLRYRRRLAHPCYTFGMGKFKIGQSVRLRSTVQSGGDAHCEYRIIRQLAQADDIIRYRVRSSADERDEMVVKESQIRDGQNSPA
jgi:hypothetical protein